MMGDVFMLLSWRTVILTSALFLTFFMESKAQIVQFSGASNGSGFTNVVPTSPVCQGINTSCSGSQVIYISQSGTDSGSPGSPGSTGTCTQSAPCKSLNYGCSLLRNNSADQLLLKGGDIWPTTDVCGTTSGGSIGTLNGSSSCSNVGGTCSGPILFGYYNGSAGRPEIDSNASSPVADTCWKATGSTYNNIVIQGWYCHAVERDPTLSTYDFAGANDGGTGIQASAGLTSWLLIEDCEVAYYQFDFTFEPPSTTPLGTIIFRRNIIVHSYGLGGSSSSDYSGDSSGIFLGAATGTVEDNFFYMTGWDNILTAPQNVTIVSGTGVITWPTSNYAFNALPFGNGTAVFFKNNDTGAGITAGTPYCVENVSGSTFKVSATFSGGTSCGTAKTGFTSTSNVMQWGDPALIDANHSLYDIFGGGSSIVNNNISLWSNDLMELPGGQLEGNFTSNDVNELTAGSYQGQESGLTSPTITSLTMSGNVLQHTLAAYPGQQGRFTYPGDGGASNAYSLNNASGSGIQQVNNIFSQLGSGGNAIVLSNVVSGDTSNTVTQNNIVYISGVSIQNLGNANNVITPQTCVDLSGANTGCADEPFSNPLLDVFSYDSTQIGGPGTCSGTGPPTPSNVGGVIGTGNNCMADFVNKETGRGPGSWPTDLTACAIINHVSGGFGTPYGTCTQQ